MRNEQQCYMPAEWAPHERTLMQWPVRDSMVNPENYDAVSADYGRIAAAISEFEPVTMLINEESMADASGLCGGRAELLTVAHSDGWFRDNGPTFLLNEENILSAVKWRFNAWGEKYLPYELDDAAAPIALKQLQIPWFPSSIILEGGSIHTDGEGTLLTTRECLLHPSRNPGLSQEEISAELRRCLGVSQIIWLNRGLSGDETDGHVDNIACFAAPGVVLMQVCRDPSDPNFEITQENLKLLRSTKDAAGRTPEVIELPQPPARFDSESRLTLSYLNFYLVNGGLLLPVFGGDAAQTDAQAADILQKTFPGRRVVALNTSALITEGGNIHCVTQQMPRGIHP
ncbi:MAG: agmatine deiminase [Oscillospiraceae bacterium]|nr:agmatine deiminase [Oscillospiraceae bacterium]